MEFTIDQTLKDFAITNGQTWKAIDNSSSLSEKCKELLKNAFNEQSIPRYSSDVDIVLFGSIARNECTTGSDVDWTLLIDSQADPSHQILSFGIKRRLNELHHEHEEIFAPPGTTDLFGQMSFSHDIVHNIGGEDDSNQNITKRVLLLLESEKIAINGTGTAYDRVIRSILQQYVRHDSSFRSDRGLKHKVPRFLLNDIIRFWRTMCVDFAYKQKDQQGKKWALRNLKLRMSRKLTFIKGLLMCCQCFDNESLSDSQDVEDYLKSMVAIKPLQFLLTCLKNNHIDDELILKLFGSYNKFLDILNQGETRKEFERLDMYEVYNNEKFMNARGVCDDFQKVLDEIFLVKESTIKEFVLRYGLF